MTGLAASAIWEPTVPVAVAALWPVSGRACSACVEDKVTVLYDHAVVQQPAARGNVVGFHDVRGPMDLARLAPVVVGARGVKLHGMHVSQQPAALPFVLDTGTLTPLMR